MMSLALETVGESSPTLAEELRDYLELLLSRKCVMEERVLDLLAFVDPTDAPLTKRTGRQINNRLAAIIADA